MKRRRLFVAVALDGVVRAECARAAERLRDAGWIGRWVPPENYHLTVAFLGAVDDARIVLVCDALRDVAASVPAFDLTLDAVGTFPHARKPRVAWVGPSREAPAFAMLCGVVRSALSAHGFSFDRHADPHVTLARADGTTPLPAVAAPRAVQARCDALTLYESVTERTGARYVPLSVFPLADAPS